MFHMVLKTSCVYIELKTKTNTGFTLTLSLQGTYEAKRKEFIMELQRKEDSMRQMFVTKVKETEAELKEKEKVVRIEIIEMNSCS